MEHNTLEGVEVDLEIELQEVDLLVEEMEDLMEEEVLLGEVDLEVGEQEIVLLEEMVAVELQ
jgi:hypothetical protein